MWPLIKARGSFKRAKMLPIFNELEIENRKCIGVRAGQMVAVRKG